MANRGERLSTGAPEGEAVAGRDLASGPLTMLCGYVLLGLQPVPVGALGSLGWSAPWVVMARFAFALGAVALLCLLRRRGLVTGNPRLLLWRGVFGGVAVLLYFTSVQLAGVGTATVLNYTYPLWANVFAAVFWKQRVPAAFWALLALALVGVVLIVDPGGAVGGARPASSGVDSSAVLGGRIAGLTSALAAGAAVLCIKKLRATDESLTIITSFSVVGLLLAAPFALAPHFFRSGGLVGVPASVGDSGTALPTEAGTLLLLVSVGALAFAGHLLFTHGYKHTSVALGTSLSLSVPVIATAAGACVLGERLSVHFATGTFLVLVACAAIAWISTPRADTLQR